MTFNEFTSYWNDYDTLITEMQEAVLKVKMRDGNIDVSKQESRIESIRKLQDLFHRMYYDRLTYTSPSLNEHLKVLGERDKMLHEIARLTKENNNLKQTIKF